MNPPSNLEPAPGAKAATRLGIWSLLSNLLCGCFPVAIGLGIGAIIKQGKAKQAAQAEPARYAPPTNTGLVTGIIGICWTVFALAYLGIISAIAIPAFQGQRDRARSLVVQGQVDAMAAEASRAALDQARAGGRAVDPSAVVQEVLAEPAFRLPRGQNAFVPGECAFVAADAPDHDGQVALKGGYTRGGDGQSHPAVQIQAQVRRGGRSEAITKVVTLD